MSLNDHVKDVLECPVCLIVPRKGPIYQCNRGHIVCNVCRSNLAICPQCNATLRYNVRCLVAEKMRDNVGIPCKFGGCNVEMQRLELERHEKLCAHREVECPGPECKKIIPLPKLVDHIHASQSHSIRDFLFINYFPPLDPCEKEIISVSDYIFTENEIHDWPCDKFSYDQAYFFCRKRRNRQGLWFIWLYMLEIDDFKINDYACTISIVKTDENGFESKITSTVAPLSLDVSAETVEETQRCLVFTDKIAKNFNTKRVSHFFEQEGVEYMIDIHKNNFGSPESKKRKLQ